MSKIRPIPEANGVGFFAMESLKWGGYRYEQVGRYHNYHFTNDCHDWPKMPVSEKEKWTIDGFSPNLNKDLHVGHLRQLALANALSHLLPNAIFVAMIGATLGVKEGSMPHLIDWFDFIGYHPKIYMDTILAEKYTIDGRLETDGHYKGAIIWDGPKGPVVIRKTDGNTTYSYHDLCLVKEVAPDAYITGAEQKEHFERLGLLDKHYPMGLVLGPDNKKLKSRSGDALSATETVEAVLVKLDETPSPKELAWNVLAWNFLHVARPQNVKFEVDKWTEPDAPGLYISYTYARLQSAIKKIEKPIMIDARQMEYTPIDLQLIGFSEYAHYYVYRAKEALDLAGLANFTHDLARWLGNVYHIEKIVDGRPAFQNATQIATHQLGQCMKYLGMFRLESV